jgi:hypothetical protein
VDDQRVDGDGTASPVEPPRHSVEIEWVYDEYDCETCGPSYAEGAIVRVDNVVILEMMPHAHCYSSESYEPEEVYNALLNRFGFDVVIKENIVYPPPIVDEDDDDEDKL